MAGAHLEGVARAAARQYDRRPRARRFIKHVVVVRRRRVEAGFRPEGRGFQPREEARHEALIRFDDRRVAFMVVAPQLFSSNTFPTWCAATLTPGVLTMGMPVVAQIAEAVVQIRDKTGILWP